MSQSSPAALRTVTIYNQSSTALTIWDLNGGPFNSGAYYGFGADTNPNDGLWTVTTITNFDDTHTYNLGQYFQQTVGHQFNFVGGLVNPLGTPSQSQFFQVVDGNKIYVSGIKTTFHWVTNGPGQPTYELLCLNAGCNNGGGAGWLNNPPGLDYVVNLPPADTNFNGVYPSIQFFSSGSSLGTLTLGTNDGIANWTGTGHSFVRTGPYSIRVTTDKGNVFDITSVPEPSALGMVTVAAAAILGWRRHCRR
jgi:hypothetical protein